ncbi:hypothetical protein QR680_014317 [Steinernema hermaphroditum]|uniref:Uncharacterized protein n=1 Tax=Steinernema hermaphroditum TaxID=289476 RepID=A0AA39I8H8_9BILA|nr:hypothetical protein QR680_014317 [Steinernema hermaphroditum]
MVVFRVLPLLCLLVVGECERRFPYLPTVHHIRGTIGDTFPRFRNAENPTLTLIVRTADCAFAGTNKNFTFSVGYLDYQQVLRWYFEMGTISGQIGDNLEKKTEITLTRKLTKEEAIFIEEVCWARSISSELVYQKAFQANFINVNPSFPKIADIYLFPMWVPGIMDVYLNYTINGEGFVHKAVFDDGGCNFNALDGKGSNFYICRYRGQHMMGIPSDPEVPWLGKDYKELHSHMDQARYEQCFRPNFFNFEVYSWALNFMARWKPGNMGVAMYVDGPNARQMIRSTVPGRDCYDNWVPAMDSGNYHMCTNVKGDAANTPSYGRPFVHKHYGNC